MRAQKWRQNLVGFAPHASVESELCSVLRDEVGEIVCAVLGHTEQGAELAFTLRRSHPSASRGARAA